MFHSLRRCDRVAIGLLTSVLVCSAQYAEAATLQGTTSKPNSSVYVSGEPVTLHFDVSELKPDEKPSLKVTVSDADETVLLTKDLPVTPAADGKWSTDLPAPADKLGFYRVTARLSSGETLPEVGSRPAGYFPYLVVVDPKQRAIPGENAFFGMQGSFRADFDPRVLLGIHWVLGGYKWGDYEPDRPGQFAEKRKEKPGDGRDAAMLADEAAKGILRLPTLLNGTPKWAVVDNKTIYTTGVIQNLDAWRAFCLNVAKARIEDEPNLKRHVYQITWEPVYPWGFPSSDPNDLVRSYEVAYKALHEADPKAFVIGPTGAGMSATDVTWNENLLKHGLAKHLDGYSVHPYIGQPPETNNLPGNIRALKELIRTYAGHDLPMWGTEQGWATKQEATNEPLQAMWLTRSYLIMQGEGFDVNFAFYLADYPGEPGYGFFHNLKLKTVPWNPDSVSPKPVAGAFAALTYLLENHRSAGPIEWLGSTTQGYAFERRDKPEQVTLALWDWGQTPRRVSLPVGVTQVQIFDWMGNPHTVATPNKTLDITLGPKPQYIRGVAASLWGSGAERPLTLTPAQIEVFPGQNVKLMAHVSGAVKNVRLRVDTPPEWNETTQLPTVTGANTPLTLRIPTDAPFGAFPVSVTLERDGTLTGLAATTLRVREPFAVTNVVPSGVHSLRLQLQNRTPQPLQAKLQLRLRGVPQGRQSITVAIPASGTKVVDAAFPDAPLDGARVYTLESTLESNGLKVQGSHRATFLSAPKATPDLSTAQEWKGSPHLIIAGREAAIREPQLYHGNADLSGDMQTAWDEKAFYLRVQVRDDVMLQTQDGFNTWKQDCLQVAFDTAPGKASTGNGNQFAEAGSRTNSEISLALTPKGPQAFRTIAPGSGNLPVDLLSSKAVPLTITRNGDTTLYQAAFPWRELGREAPHDGDVLGFALTINDADDPAQNQPKAIGLFGGIFPSKDPSQFGTLVLANTASVMAQAPNAPSALRFEMAGTMGQSEADKPLPFVGISGVARDATGALWITAGNTAYAFENGQWKRNLTLPTSVKQMRGDGKALYLWGDDQKFYRVDPASGNSAVLASTKLPDEQQPRAFTLDSQSNLWALSTKGAVYRWRDNTWSLMLQATLPDGGLISIGIDPKTNDILLSSGWPDSKIYRFDSTGKSLSILPAPTGFATQQSVLDGEAWLISESGRSTPAPLPGDTTVKRVIDGNWSFYPTGLVSDGQGGSWLASSQGLLHFDRRGHSDERRIGGLANAGLLSASPDGTLIALLESNGRIARLWADDDPSAPISANSNEPWRVGQNWQSRAAGIAWYGDGFLVLDNVQNCLWRFDSAHTAWGEKPWIRLTPEKTFTKPRALAFDDERAWVLDGDNLLTLNAWQWETAPTKVALPTEITPAAITSLTAANGQLFIATDKELFSLSPDGHLQWRQGGFTQIAAIHAVNSPSKAGLIAVADRGAKNVKLLSGTDGVARAQIAASDIPNGWEPVGLTAQNDSIWVSDVANARLVRLRLRS